MHPSIHTYIHTYVVAAKDTNDSMVVKVFAASRAEEKIQFFAKPDGSMSKSLFQNFVMR